MPNEASSSISQDINDNLSDEYEDDNEESNNDSNSITTTLNQSFNSIFKKPYKKVEAFKNNKTNNINYSFSALKSYLIKEGLFTFNLLDIDYSTPRKVEFKYIVLRYSYKCVLRASRPQIGSNGSTHYREHHKEIAYNKESEAYLIKSKLLIVSNI